MNPKKTAWLAWGLCGIITIVAIIKIGINLAGLGDRANSFATLYDSMVWSVEFIVFAWVGALILSRQPQNTIGWLLMIPASLVILSALTEPFDLVHMTTPPHDPSLTFLIAVWIDYWSWMLLVFPVLLIPLLFPTGQPPSPRWRWLIIAGLGMCAFFIFFATFSADLGPSSGELAGTWSIPNPIGFLESDAFPFVVWSAALGIFTVLSAASLFLRYRHAAAVARQQIKWLLYACAIFAAIYVFGLWINARLVGTSIHLAWSVLFSLATLTIPIAIGIAILRYRLWDIDVIIRKTLVYGALTATLGLVFFGGVALLEGVVGRLTGTEDSPVVIVISTLLIAALFAPLRRRIQDFIDRRFYRQKYNAEQALDAFASAARDETDLEALTVKLAEVVSQTMQPEQVSLWLRKGKL